ILHAAQGDQECLFTAYETVAKPSLDTAVAASLLGYGESIGLANLLKSAMGVTLKKGHARTNWTQRPLPDQLLQYAAADVEHLVKLGDLLIEDLEKEGRLDWAMELTSKWEDPAIYLPDPDGIAERLAVGGKLDDRAYSTLIGLVRWREARVRDLNIPRRWLADDAVLIDIARVRPKDSSHLASFRGLNKGELRNSGDRILAIVKEFENLPPPARIRGLRLGIPSASETRVMELLKCYISILADELRISPRLLMTADQFFPILRSKDQIHTVDDLVSRGLLGTAAAKLIGSEILAMVHGQRALQVDGMTVRVVNLTLKNTGP
ncbi:MAG: HRDC domain-containing protein, partial [Bdellovibrionota bacterium]